MNTEQLKQDEKRLTKELIRQVKHSLQVAVDLNELSSRTFYASYHGHCNMLAIKGGKSKKEWVKPIFKFDLGTDINSHLPIEARIVKLQSKIQRINAAIRRMKELAIGAANDEKAISKIKQL